MGFRKPQEKLENVYGKARKIYIYPIIKSTSFVGQRTVDQRLIKTLDLTFRSNGFSGGRDVRNSTRGIHKRDGTEPASGSLYS